MPVTRYVGRTTWFRGKRLYDILSRLKNFGKGRIVYRHVFSERYPEPSYYIITKVDPDMRDPTEKVKVLKPDQNVDNLSNSHYP